MAKRLLVCIFAGAAVLIPSTIATRTLPDWRDDMSDINRISYDPSAEQVYEGIAASNGHPLAGLMYFTLRSSDKTLEIQIGPQEFIEQSGFKFKIGEMVTVVGMPLVWNRRDIVLARRVSNMTTVLIVRDREGHPKWEMKGPVQMDPEIPNPNLCDMIEP